MLRNEAAHRQYCALLEEDSSGEVSKQYDINRDSILNELAYFHMCNGSLVPDVMHDILEGALQYEVKLMLQFMIDTEKYFTLEELNTRLEHIELGYMEYKDRPTAISVATLRSSGSSLKQKGMRVIHYRRNVFHIHICYFQQYSCTDVAVWPDSSNASSGSRS